MGDGVTFVIRGEEQYVESSIVPREGERVIALHENFVGIVESVEYSITEYGEGVSAVVELDEVTPDG